MSKPDLMTIFNLINIPKVIGVPRHHDGLTYVDSYEQYDFPLALEKLGKLRRSKTKIRTLYYDDSEGGRLILTEEAVPKAGKGES